MPMPETITQEDLARWDASWESFDPADKGIPVFFKEIPGMKERVWYTGEWLGEQLRALGCPEDVAQEILTACGQRQVAARDPWVSAVQAVEDYRAGQVNTNVPTMMIDRKAGSLTYVSDGNRKA